MNEPVDSRRLQTFAVLAETGSHRQTAQRLFVTHSAISHSIRTLEEQLSCRLFTKVGKRVALTEAGEAFLYHTQRALKELEQARQSLAHLNKWGTQRLRVAVESDLLSTFLAPVLLKFHKEFPKISLLIESFNSDESLGRLQQDKVDVLLTEKPADNEPTSFFPIHTDRFHLVVKAGHPLASKDAVLKDEFGKYPCFLLKGAAQHRKQVENFMFGQKNPVNVLAEIESLEVIKKILESTLAISFLPAWSIAAELESQKLIALPHGRNVFERTWGLVHHRSRPLNFAQSTLLKLCRKRVAESESKSKDVVKVGVLHSLSGTMAISETSLRDVLLFAFDEINHAGGIKVGGKSFTIEPVVVDGASNWSLFAEKAKELLVEDKVAVTFGCWTSVSRKSVQPIFEKENGLLFYPVQYEGEELSRNIFYVAETLNQQAIPAVDYLLEEGKKRFYLIGTDYVYPQTTNRILYKYLLSRGVPSENIGGGFSADASGEVLAAGRFVPFGHTEFQSIVADIKRFSAPGDACVINTINGDSNVHFFKKIVAAGLKPAICPVVSFSLAEDELRSLPTKNLIGEIGCWSYFMSLKNQRNKIFLKNWNDWLKHESYPGVIREKRAVDSPIVHAYSGVYLWKAAVEKAGTFEVNAVRAMLESGQITFQSPGGKITVQANHHCTKDVYIGRTTANGQFKILKTLSQIAPEPFITSLFP